MKKLLVLLSSLFIFANLFTACGNTSNTPELTEEEEYTNFYNKIAAHTWVASNLNMDAGDGKIIKKMVLQKVEATNTVPENMFLFYFDASNSCLNANNDMQLLYKNNENEFGNKYLEKKNSNLWTLGHITIEYKNTTIKLYMNFTEAYATESNAEYIINLIQQ